MQDYIEESDISGVFVIKRPVFADSRGFFRETFRKNELDDRLGFSFDIVQANHSRSQKDTLRGLHIAPWHKLVTVLNGLVQQIVVDLREDSQTFGKHVSILLGEDNWSGVFIPKNCGNGFLVLTPSADYNYLTSENWVVGKEKYILYNDPDLNIPWQTNNPLVSEKDQSGKFLKDLFPAKVLNEGTKQ
ncbi:MAG TPA: dTDP-4-dehydrorhamnose 3,5-epimerase [Patescibacteria group bacterium]